MSEMVTIYINPELEERFIKKCESLKVKADVVVNKLIEEFVEGHTLLKEEEFAEGLTVGEYLDLSENEKDVLWARWEKVAEQEVGYLVKDVKPDALPPR